MEVKKFWRSFERFLKREEKKAEEFIEYEETLLSKWGYKFLKTFFGPIIRWIWIKEVRGLENIPKESAVIIASNHMSYFDFFCFIAISPRNIHYLAAEKFLYSRFWRALIALTGQVVVNRWSKDKSREHQIVFSLLKQKRMFGIFPEGTRSQTGKIQKPFTGVARFALKSQTPIIPVGISGTYEIMPPSAKFPKLLKHCSINIGKPIYLHDHYKIANGDEENKKLHETITHHVMKEVAQLCGQDYPHDKDSHNQ
ncbi:MAG: lysophospholipid acyltransferase family protein [Candidatus Giovannonibacteria bacterium]|nr:lysophospholipid acyltransferase family protein [Candidatus Giovannonibacteria bacterium]